VSRRVDSNDAKRVSGTLPLQQESKSAPNVPIPDQCQSQKTF
jgi:hypothetical protein